MRLPKIFLQASSRGTPVNKTSILAVFGACAWAFAATPALARGEAGNLMKVTSTTKMQMPGMSMPARTQTRQVCVSASRPDPRQMLKLQKDCTISHLAQTADSLDYHMSCAGEMRMDADAHFRMHDGGMHGTIHSVSDASGQAMTMDMSFDGVRVGGCEYTSPAE
jgi:hypothetical protein